MLSAAPVCGGGEDLPHCGGGLHRRPPPLGGGGPRPGGHHPGAELPGEREPPGHGADLTVRRTANREEARHAGAGTQYPAVGAGPEDHRHRRGDRAVHHAPGAEKIHQEPDRRGDGGRRRRGLRRAPPGHGDAPARGHPPLHGGSGQCGAHHAAAAHLPLYRGGAGGAVLRQSDPGRPQRGHRLL